MKWISLVFCIGFYFPAMPASADSNWTSTCDCGCSAGCAGPCEGQVCSKASPENPAPQVDTNAQMINNIRSGVMGLINIFGSKPSPSGAYRSNSSGPARYQGEVIKRSSSGPSASQQKALSSAQKRAQEPQWQTENVADRIKPPPDKAKDMSEAIRKDFCDTGFGYDPYAGAAVQTENVSIKGDGQPEYAVDTVADVAGAGSGESWQAYAQAWCKPLPTIRGLPGKAAPKPEDGEGKKKQDKKMQLKEDGGQTSKGGFIAHAISKPKKKVKDKKEEVENLDNALGDMKGLGDALKEAPKKAEKLPEEKKKSMLAEIQAMRRDNETAIAATEQKKQQASKELQQAQKELGQTKQEAREALKDDSKFQDFHDKHAQALEDGTLEDLKEGGLPLALPDMSLSRPKTWEASLRLWRPSADEAHFVIEVQKMFGEEGLPYPNAQIKISWSQAAYQVRADPMGRAFLPPLALAESWSDESPQLEIKTEMEKVSHSLKITRQELDHYLKSGAELLAKKAYEEFVKSRYEEATRDYWQSLSWHPTDKASEGWLASLEKQGVKHSTLEAYRLALTQHVKDPGERHKLKQKAVEAARRVKPAPLPVPGALEYLNKAQEAFQKEDKTDCLIQLEAAASLAPWWHEPYYSQAQVFQYMAFQNSLYFSQAAIQNYDLFLAAAPSDDPRISQAKTDKKDLEDLQVMMSK